MGGRVRFANGTPGIIYSEPLEKPADAPPLDKCFIDVGAAFDELLEIVRNVRAEVVAARTQLTRGQLLVADVIKQQRLHRIDVGAAAAVGTARASS